MRIISRALGIALLFALLQEPASGGGFWYITVKVCGESTYYEMRDSRDGRILDQSLGRQPVRIILQSSQETDDGYGDLDYRRKGDSAWRHIGRLRNDETITL